MNPAFLSTIILWLLVIVGCSNNSRQPGSATTASMTTGKLAPENYLSMKINGVEWKADHNIFGAFHPKGHNKAIMISGSKNSKEKNEQLFNINIYNTDGPGVFVLKDGNPDFSVAQLANMSPENYLYGSMLGFHMKVTVTKVSTSPDEIEATFEGELSGNSGIVLKITEGKFYFQE